MNKLLLRSCAILITVGSFSQAHAFFGKEKDKKETTEYCEKKHHKNYKGKHFEHMLEKMDSNSDGKIDKQEFLTKSEERFKFMDVNNDGLITKDEVKEHHKKMKEKFKSNRKKQDK